MNNPPGYDDHRRHNMAKVTRAEREALLANGWTESPRRPYLDLAYTYNGQHYKLHLTPADAVTFEEGIQQDDPLMIRINRPTK